MRSPALLQTGKTTLVATAPFFKNAGVLPKSTPEGANGLYQGVGYNYGKVKVHRDDKRSTNPVRVQPKLAINQPGDIYEQEADAMAEKVIRMPSPFLNANKFFKPATSPLQRKCAHCEEEGKQRLHRKETKSSPVADFELDTYVGGLSSSGQPLPNEILNFFEPHFGYDFSNVKVHTDSAASKSAHSMNALAYTSGNNVVFNKGQYSPGTERGKRLLAHELTHVVQQRNAPKSIQRLIRSPYPWLGIITPAIGANIRSSTNSSSPANIIGSIPKGQTVRVLANSGNWLQVESHYRGPLVTGYIFNTLVDDATSASMSASVGTTMVWTPSGPGSGTDFERWASAPAETPFPAVTAATVMNCWEAVLLSAYRSGAINWIWIHNMYVSIPAASWVSAMSRGPRHTYAIPGPNAHMPQRGDIVFFDGIAHVALATGAGSDVYTFWPPPNTPFTPGGTTDKVKVFTIEQLVTWWTANSPPAPVVEFGAPSW